MPTYTAGQAQRGGSGEQEGLRRVPRRAASGHRGPRAERRLLHEMAVRPEYGRGVGGLRDTMPVDAEDSVPENEKLDALAYLLQVNGLVEGTEELPRFNTLSKMRVPPKPGAASKVGALVETTGCLQKGPGDEWLVTSRDESAGPGRTWRLINVFSTPTIHVGHTVKVTGLLVRNTRAARR